MASGTRREHGLARPARPSGWRGLTGIEGHPLHPPAHSLPEREGAIVSAGRGQAVRSSLRTAPRTARKAFCFQYICPSGHGGVGGWQGTQAAPGTAVFSIKSIISRVDWGASGARTGKTGGQSRASGPAEPCVGNPRPTREDGDVWLRLFPPARRQGAPPGQSCSAVGSGALV